MKTEQNGKGPRERRFEMWADILGGTFFLAGLAAELFVPYEIRGDIFVPWFVIFSSIISYKYWQVRRIRQEEQAR